MKQLVQTLPNLQAAVGAASACGLTPGDVDGYVRAIARKARFATFHLRVLEGIKWDEVDGLGRAFGSADRARLEVVLDDIKLEFSHPEAVVDYVYMAFDGLTAAVVNMTDTLGRLVNGTYSLGIPVRQASLIAVNKACKPTSALGTVLCDPQHKDWLQAVRDLRGQCQHSAIIEDVLVHKSAPYAQRGEPVVLQRYCWRTPQVDIPIVTYASEAMLVAEATMVTSIAAITSSPQNPTV